jgi:hypothetical protein
MSEQLDLVPSDPVALAARLQDANRELEALKGELNRLRLNIRRLLDQVGDSRPCKGVQCKATIWYVRLKGGRVAPYTIEALNHFADCPDAEGFRRGKSDEPRG